MGRYRHQVNANDTTPRWVVVFGLQRQVIESQQLEAAACSRRPLVGDADILARTDEKRRVVLNADRLIRWH
jgi:hypothetical protein